MLKKLIFILFSILFPAYASSMSMEEFKHSWTATALKLQREMDINTPFSQIMMLGTHNSENSKAYEIPFVRYVDPNQTLSIYDQLDLGIRSLELDVQWTMDKHLSHAILLCHGQYNHVGCSAFDKPVAEALQEIRDWLTVNPKEIVMIYLDRALDGHEPRLANELNQVLGEFIFKPTQLKSFKPQPQPVCKALPGSLTKQEVLNAGKQVIVVTKNCDGLYVNYQETDQFKLPWNDIVFSGIDHTTRNPFTILDTTINGFTGYPDCDFSTDFFDDPLHHSMWRVFEDRTILSNIEKPQKKLLVNDMKELQRCGINIPAMDMLEIDDSRLTAAVWSWAASYPKENQGHCAIYKMNEGIENVPCTQTIAAYACKNSENAWKILSTPGQWKEGETLCQSTFGSDWHFSTPMNGNQLEIVKQALQAHSEQEIWLNYSINKQGRWQVA